MGYTLKEGLIEPISPYVTIHDHLCYLKRLEKVQLSFMGGEYITRKALTEKRVIQRSTSPDYEKRNEMILERIKKSIDHYEKLRDNIS